MAHVGQFFAVVLVTCAIAGCAPNAPKYTPTPVAPPEVSQRVLTDDEFSVVTAALHDVLKDPESARIRGVKVAIGGLNDPLNGSSHVCGEVNAKNSYGGYTGYSPFWGQLITKGGVPVGARIFEIGAPNTLKHCRNNRLVPGRD